MSLEIEKKFIVNDFKLTFNKLKHDFGDYKLSKKHGFWFCNNYDGMEKILNIKEPKILKKTVSIIKGIGEFIVSDEDFQFIRLRIKDKKNRIITFKNKSLVNDIEQNTEYEFNPNENVFNKIVRFLKDTSLIFYYNIKETWEFKKNDITLELSKINDLRDSYLEIETIGNSDIDLHEKLNKFLIMLTDYQLKEETRNYVQLFFIQNNEKLKSMNLNQYSREGFKLLLNEIEK